jgi:hypothetical protein
MKGAAIAGVVILICLSVLVAVFMKMSGSPSPSPTSAESNPLQAKVDDLANQAVQRATVDKSSPDELNIGAGDEGSDFAGEVESEGASPDTIDGLVGWYDGDSWDEGESKWMDKSGNGNDVTEILGAPVVDTDEVSGRKVLVGSTEDGLRFPAAVMTTAQPHTLFHVTKYSEGGSMGRVFDGVDNNYLSGLWNSQDRVAHRTGSGWVSWPWTGNDPTKFKVYTDQKHQLNVNGVQISGEYHNSSAARPSQMSINNGEARANEASDWLVGEVIFFNRELNREEQKSIENWLMNKWKISPFARISAWTTNAANLENDMDVAALHNHGASCPNGAMYMTRMHRHKSWDATTESHYPNTWFYYETGCKLGTTLDAGEATSKNTPSVPVEGGVWTDKMKKLMDLDCGNKPIQSFRFKKVGNKVKTEYKCSAAGTDERSCTEQYGFQHGNWAKADADNLFEGLDLKEITCHPKVLTKLELLSNAPRGGEGFDYKATCCALEDV